MRDTWQCYPNAVAVTPSDTANLAKPAMALLVTGTGNVTLDTVGGQTSVLFTALAANAILPVQTVRVRATGTTATGIIALY